MVRMNGNTRSFQINTMNSNTIMFDRNSMKRPYREESDRRKVIKRKVTSLSKPACVSKRTVSLPADLQNNDVSTKALFWFLPRDQQQRLCHKYQTDVEVENNNVEDNIKSLTTNGRSPRSCHKCFEKSNHERDPPPTSEDSSPFTCIQNLRDDPSKDGDDKDCLLLGLEFLGCLEDIDIGDPNENLP